MGKLRSIPYFNAGYEVEGISAEEFDAIPALQATYHEFSNATNEMVAFVAERMPRR